MEEELLLLEDAVDGLEEEETTDRYGSSMFCIVSFVKKKIVFLSLFFVNLRSHLATSFNQNKRMCKTWSHCNG